MTNTNRQGWKRITLYLLPEEHKQLRLVSFDANTSMTEFARTAIREKIGVQAPTTDTPQEQTEQAV